MLLERVTVKDFEDAEIYVSASKVYRAEAEDSKLKTVSAGSSLTLAVRVVRDKRIGFYYTSVRSLDDLQRAAEQAYRVAEKAARLSQRVEWWKGFASSKCSKVPGIYSKALAGKDVDYVVEMVKRALDVAPQDLSVMGGAELKVRTWALLNTEGTEYEESETSLEMGLWASRRVNGYLTKTIGDVFVSRAHEPDVDSFASKVYEEAKTLVLRPKRISGEYTVYFDPRATADLLDFLAEAFYANNVARNTSPLSGKLGKEVFSEKLTLSDNPALPGGPESHGCDEEGVKSEPLVMVDKGVLKAYLGDLYWGYKVGFVGRGYRPDPGSPPTPSYTNLTLHAGDGAEGEVVVAGLTGLHTASPETGDMSVVLSPAWYKGEHVEAVMTVNVYDLLGERLEGVGKEGRWVGSVFTPGVAARVKLS